MAKTVLKIVTGIVALALVFVAWVYPVVPTASYTLGGLLVVLLAVLAWLNQRELREAMKTRSVRYGTNAMVTVGLVAAIVVVLNFLNYSHFYRKDFTKNKTHSLSDQTVKILKDLNQEVKLTVFAKTAERDPVKSIIDNYGYHTKKLSVEYVDPDRDPTRAKASNVKKYNTVLISSGKRDTRIEDVTEEKLTNALVKVLKDKPVTICFLTGHGEKSADANEVDAYTQIKTELSQQNYQSKSFSLFEEAKVPADCSVLMVLGPNKAFFDKEIEALRSWLEAGGKMLAAVDPDLKGNAENTKQFRGLLEQWFIQVNHNLVLDPRSKLLGASASVPLVGVYSKDHVITRDFQAAALFPLASTLEFKSNPPTSIKTWWLAKSMPGSFAKNDFKAIATGQVKLGEKSDVPGPHIMMLAVEGQKTADKKPAARIVTIGTSQLASNRWAAHGSNLDLFMNAVSWLADDESMISIRPKDEQNNLPTLTDVEANYIGFLVKFATPGATLLAGLVVWRRRRRL